MTKKVELRFAQAQFDTLYQHLYPGDHQEHAAIVLATLVERPGQTPRALVRDVLLAKDGVDYVVSPEGHGRLLPQFINKAIVRCRNERLMYFHVHNHGSDQSVGFSDVDYASHQRGYPALLDIVKGMPVGGMVFGYRSLEIDLWWPDKTRSRLARCLVVGSRIRRLYSHPREAPKAAYTPSVDRQVLFLGEAGQAQLQSARVAVVGLGGVGSMVVQDLARLGVGSLLLIDSDVLDETNLSRVVTAVADDIKAKPSKTRLSVRYAKAVNPKVDCETLQDDVAYQDVADKLADCDYIFLCADTMRARLVVNAVVNQHFVPAVQVGSKILVGDKSKRIEQFYSVVRQMRPGGGCLLCNGFISPHRLAIEEKSDADWRAQNYGTGSPNPSVITLNGIGSSRSTHDFLLDFVASDLERPSAAYYMYDVFKGTWLRTNLRSDADCPECSTDAESRFAKGMKVPLPCRQRPAPSQTTTTNPSTLRNHCIAGAVLVVGLAAAVLSTS